jgi:hypothetical protein
VRYSRKIQVILLSVSLALLIITTIDLMLLYQATDIVLVKGLFSLIVPLIISSIFKELKNQDLLPKINLHKVKKVFPKIFQKKPPPILPEKD